MRWRDVKQNKIKHIEQKKPLTTLPYASNIDKFKAFITDSFLLAMPIFYIVIYFIFDGREGFQTNILLGWAYILIPLGIIIVLFQHISGQTPGMKAYEIKIIDNNTKEKPSLLSAMLRFFFFNMVLFTFLGLFLPIFTKDRRGIQDFLSGTSIIKATS